MLHSSLFREAPRAIPRERSRVCQGLPVEMETAPAEEVQLPSSGMYQDLPFCPQGKHETAKRLMSVQ